MAAGDPTPSKKWDWGMYALIVFLVLVPLLMIGLPPLVALLRGQSLSDAAAGTRTADDVLNFLEGASVLIGGAVAVAAIYGFRNAQEVRRELKEEQDALREKSRDLQAREIELEKQIVDAKRVISGLQRNTVELSEAHRDLLHRNYKSAYGFARSVLARDPENIQALYISGWLSMQHVPGRTVDDAINDLEKAYDLVQIQAIQRRRSVREGEGADAQAKAAEMRRALIEAALGVMYRRKWAHCCREAEKKLEKSKEKDREKKLEEARAKYEPYRKKAVHYLEAAIGRNEHGIDPFSESFYGPLGGLYRDSAWYAEKAGKQEQAEYYYGRAEENYKRAMKVTPGSSYPRGNYAQLILRRAKRAQDSGDKDAAQAFEEEALKRFQATYDIAWRELGANPEDYYHVMDIAMSAGILGVTDPAKLAEAREKLDTALSMAVTGEQLRTSWKGWVFLKESCPSGEKWNEVLAFLKKAEGDVKAKQKELAEKPSTDKEKGGSVKCS